ncbi:unnamed protein product [Adineta steineri]|uniref:Uncharacterized protein n=1 Tax=Adineta steineri TaxID=433720 RepID=A0A814IBM4_9BILA|nr:unnamed protein product [Adineta steineri]CAF3786832.1 unnamed protein product [Adineta steineri]
MLETTTILIPTINASCSFNLKKLSISNCRFISLIHGLTYFLLALSLLPQIIHLFKYGRRYIAGISYIWIIIRILALTLLIVANTMKWTIIFEFIAILTTFGIFLQIINYSNNLGRQNKLKLILFSLFICFVGGSMIFLLTKQKNLLINIGYILLAVHILPQILLNSFLRTTKALSEFAIILLLLSDIFLFYYIVITTNSLIHSISIYYCCSFDLYILLQSIVYVDADIHIISRSDHTVLTPGIDILHDLESGETRNVEKDSEMYHNDDVESIDGSDIIYQKVTTNKSPIPATRRAPMNTFSWYASVGWIIFVEILLTLSLINHVRSLWVIIIPLAFPVILGIFFLIRTKLNVLSLETLRKIL